MQLQNTIQNSNATVGGDYVNHGQAAMTVRSVGLFGGGTNPVTKVLGLKSPSKSGRVSIPFHLLSLRETSHFI